jgi:hypothetical protein
MFPITRNASPNVQAAAATIKNLDKRSLNVMIDNFVPFMKFPAGNHETWFPAGHLRVIYDPLSASLI